MLTFYKQESIAAGCIPVTKVASTVGSNQSPSEYPAPGYPTPDTPTHGSYMGTLPPGKDLVPVIPYPLLWTDEHL